MTEVRLPSPGYAEEDTAGCMYVTECAVPAVQTQASVAAVRRGPQVHQAHPPFGVAYTPRVHAYSVAVMDDSTEVEVGVVGRDVTVTDRGGEVWVHVKPLPGADEVALLYSVHRRRFRAHRDAARVDELVEQHLAGVGRDHGHLDDRAFEVCRFDVEDAVPTSGKYLPRLVDGVRGGVHRTS
ncbi:hypothetical protein GCM10020255_026010 [Rhodococcus baikonurensis]